MPIAHNKEELIQQIRLKISEKGSSVREVANESGVSKTLIQNLLTMNPPNVSLDILFKIAKAYKVSFRFEYLVKNNS
ncbi:helix-turn-helix domain-containing protein [Leptospira bandrabouensis]|uniref:helix-turn-helix domain-containing protein n=1 Tax=Leptospira bandrabouensis TaxID=2484903 RepID=UPI003B8A884C|nr:helix-turn-helix domain-containing protein [Leptospira bandrabouensis]MCG6161852.1 helix-turn-helix domain-containing protein [Leptospira bandrabouensis]MCG6166097.1 helix-turn-helix domain-containing protein [Leptospira bandrabouensis]